MISISKYISSLTGQSAIEYLMTYGWMLLVVAVTGSAIFSITGNQSIESTSGFSGGDIAIENFGLSEDSLDFVLRNSAAEEITVNSVKITDPETGVITVIMPQNTISVSDNRVIQIPGVEQGDTSKTLEIDVNYNIGGLENLSVSGMVSGTLDVRNTLKLKNAHFNRSTNKLSIETKNIGSNSTESLSYTVEGNNTDYRGDLPNLAPGETTAINITTNQTYPLESVNLDVGGPQFTDTNSNLQCTPTEGLVGYWPFNEEQTKNGWTKDISGYENNGSLENGARKIDQAAIDYGATFGPDDRGQVKIPDDNSINPKNELTLAIWAKSRNFNDPKSQVFIDKGGDAYNKGYAMRFHGWGPGVRWNVGNGTKTCRTSPWSQNIEDSTWYNAVGVFDDGIIKMYKDSNLVDKKSCGFSQIKGTDYPLSLGRRTDWRFGYLNGTIDETRLYNRSLSQQEILRLYEVRDEEWAVTGCKLIN